MLEAILFIIGMSCVAVVLILGFLCTIPDGILLWRARKDDPEWAKLCDKQQSIFLRWKHSKGNANWGV